MTSRENVGPGARGTWAPCSLLQDRVHAKGELVTEEKAGEMDLVVPFVWV